MDIDNISLHIHALKKLYQNGEFTPRELVKLLLGKAQQLEDYNIWITVLSEDELEPYLKKLESENPDTLPLYGIPFAIKDNIDLAKVATTAACEPYSYIPERSAYVVEQLIDAGAIPLGKTNLDQFATGLVGTRSPYGACKNAFDTAYISGGSSSGSAVAVAKGLVSFSLGTDTAGSGRVPAAFNNLIGIKPSKGLFSTRGVVPACRSLDCVSIFALTADDANVVFDIVAKEDTQDPYSRPNPAANRNAAYGRYITGRFYFACPRRDQLQFFGNTEVERLFDESIERFNQLGGTAEEIDFDVFLQAAKLLYEGPWVAERYAAIESFIETKPDALYPVTREIIQPGKQPTAVTAFKGQYRLMELKEQADKIVERYDFILTPTAGTVYTIEQVQSDPIALNSNLGYYTNFMNLLDYAAVAVPAGFMDNGVPCGVTLFSSAFTDKALLNHARDFHEAQDLKLGATSFPLPKSETRQYDTTGTIRIVVCGAHMKGFPLNYQLTERKARFLTRSTTAPCYRLYALAGDPPKRPGLVRDEQHGSPIEVEVWEMPIEHFGSFMKLVPPPLGIGTLELQDGRKEKGFICEPYAIPNAVEVTGYGGWRGYLNNKR